eukprot:23641_5
MNQLLTWHSDSEVFATSSYFSSSVGGKLMCPLSHCLSTSVALLGRFPRFFLLEATYSVLLYTKQAVWRPLYSIELSTCPPPPPLV